MVSRWLVGLGILLLVGCATPAEPVSLPPGTPPLVRLEMVNASVGWGVSERGIFRSVDGGASWVDVTPPDWTYPEPPGIFGGRTASFFLDGETGWAAGTAMAGADNRGRLPVFRTTDGGRTWRTSTLDAWDLKQLVFVDRLNGWAVRHDGVATGGTEHVTLLRTVDGGETWVSLGELPYGGIKSGVSFADGLSGWATGGYTNVGNLFFYRTPDGGATWGQAELPVPERLKVNDVRPPTLWAAPPRVLAGGRLVASVSGLCEESGCTVFFHSGDGGLTWQGSPPLVYPLSAALVATFVDPDHGWAAVGARLYATADGGATWAERAGLSGVRIPELLLYPVLATGCWRGRPPCSTRRTPHLLARRGTGGPMGRLGADPVSDSAMAGIRTKAKQKQGAFAPCLASGSLYFAASASTAMTCRPWY